MKNDNTKLTYNNFNRKKFVNTNKKQSEKSILLCRLNATNNGTEASKNHRLIFKLLNSITGNPIVFENDLIYVAIMEITNFNTFLKDFKDSIMNVHSIESLAERHKRYLSEQIKIISHFREINEDPKQMPDFLKKQI